MILLLITALWLGFFGFVVLVNGPPYPGTKEKRVPVARHVIEHKGPYRLRISLTDGGGRGIKVG